MENIRLKCPIRFMGGKWRISSWVCSFFPEHKVYCEAFGGGGSVLLKKPESAIEIYNDINSDLVTLFKVLRDSGEELQRLLALTPYSREEYDLAFTPSTEPLERARQMMIISAMGFGACNFVNKQGFNLCCSPIHNAKARNSAKNFTNTIEALPLIIKRLRNVQIENTDAIGLIKRVDSPETLFFLDPPYIASTRKGGKYANEYTDANHLELLQTAKDCKGSVVLACYDSELYNEELKGWDKRTKVNTIANSKAKDLKRIETLYLNPKCSERIDKAVEKDDFI